MIYTNISMVAFLGVVAQNWKEGMDGPVKWGMVTKNVISKCTEIQLHNKKWKIQRIQRNVGDLYELVAKENKKKQNNSQDDHKAIKENTDFKI